MLVYLYYEQIYIFNIMTSLSVQLGLLKVGRKVLRAPLFLGRKNSLLLLIYVCRASIISLLSQSSHSSLIMLPPLLREVLHA